ncbi:hypothetical protein BAE44_0024521 [Dichanthelium oligosanthes]|uniref:DUF1618 domain-containing protein n=1 Tax=Dichanthelium oligosanthes TaxID=888268 RepID=A0A1E5UNK0_9POAL|nr:hypothetical protein BAE44_0024521 [Dichanthelium oligosanthes]
MPDPVAVGSRFSSPPTRVLLEDFASFGDRKNAATATGLTSGGRTVNVSFELVDPSRVFRWFVHCPGLEEKRGFNGKPEILNAADALVVTRMLFFSNSGRVIDYYFVYRAGPGKTSLDLIPGPCPEVLLPKQVGILPRGGGGGVGDCEHYSAVIPVQRLGPQLEYEIFVFSSESQAWSSKVARFSQDQETTYDEVVLHSPTKAIAAGCGSLAWIDLWRGVLLCTWLDKQPVLRLIQWPVLPERDVFIDISSPLEVRDATLSNGVIRFV